jgi:hypothetical protein
MDVSCEDIVSAGLWHGVCPSLFSPPPSIPLPYPTRASRSFSCASVASHGYRWIDYQYMGEESEREHIRKAVDITTRVCGTRPLGLYQVTVTHQHPSTLSFAFTVHVVKGRGPRSGASILHVPPSPEQTPHC